MPIALATAPVTVASGAEAVADPDFTDPIRVSGYEILGELGRGAMGVVYKARQIQLDRLVALKMILSGAHASEADRTRFRTEAEAIARMQHPHIVQVYEVGECTGKPYIALEFCSGGSLDRKLNRTPQPPAEAARLIEVLARAVHAAHLQHVIHRDLKPANVLLAADGTPKITDFGLARKLDQAGPTQTGHVMGTPSYMAPEQAGGLSKAIGPAADTYALGAILYELLTGRPPFVGATAMDTLLKVLADDPVAPRRLEAKVPRDLETICLKCLHKDPGRRYASAEDLAEDLRRFQAGEPVAARPAGRLERAAKWIRRRPTAAALLAVSTAALLLLAAASVYFTNELRFERNAALTEKAEAIEQRGRAVKGEEAARQEKAAAEHERAEKEKELERARRTLYAGQVWRAAGLWDRDPSQGRALLEDLAVCPPYRRDFAWGFYHRLCQWDRATLRGHSGVVSSVAVAPDGRTLVTGGYDRTVRVWDLATGRERLVLVGHTDEVHSVAISPDGTTVASGSADATAKLWDLSSGREIATLRGHSGQVRSLKFHPDGKLLAAGTAAFDPNAKDANRRFSKGQVKLWDLAARTPVRTLDAQSTGGVYCLAFSPDGKLVAAGVTYNHFAKVWETGTGKLQATLHPGSSGWVQCLAFAPDGKTLAYGSSDHTVKLWELSPPRLKAILRGHTGELEALAVSPDGQTLATGGVDRVVKLWDLGRQRELAVLKGHTGWILSLAYTPDGKQVVSGSTDSTAKLWDVALTPDRRNLSGHAPHGILAQAITADGALLATGSQDKTIKLWDPATGQERATLTGHGNFVTALAFRPDGRVLASGSRDKTVKLWDAKGAEIATLRGHGGTVTSVAFSPDGRLLASVGDADLGFDFQGHFVANPSEKAVKVWDAKGAAIHTFPLRGGRSTGLGVRLEVREGGLGVVSLLADGAADRDKRLKAGDRIVGVEGPDGKMVPLAGWAVEDAGRLIRGEDESAVVLFVVPAGEKEQKRYAIPRRPLAGDALAGFSRLAFSPDGRTLAASNGGQTVARWDVATGRALTSLRGTSSDILALVFAPDGRSLAAGTRTGAIEIWDLASEQSHLFPTGQNEAILSMAFAPDGRMLALGTMGRAVQLWDVPGGQQRATLTGHSREVTGVAFTGDGTTLVSASGPVNQPSWVLGGDVKVWEVGAGQQLAVAPVPSGGAHALAFASDGETGETLLVGGKDRTVRRWDTRTWKGETPHTMGAPEAGIGPVAVARDRDGHALSCTAVGNRATVWDLTASRELHTTPGHGAAITALALRPDGGALATGAADGTIKVWDVATGQELHALPRCQDASRCLAFGADGQTLVFDDASGVQVEDVVRALALRGAVLTDDRRVVRVWDLVAGKERSVLRGVPGPIRCLALAANGRTLALVAGEGGQSYDLQLWDLRAGFRCRICQGHTGTVTALAFAPDGRQLVSGGLDATLRLWDIPTIAREAAACRLRARERIEAGAWADAFAEYDRARALRPEDGLVWHAAAWRDRAWSRGQRGEWADAIADYSRALELTPEDWRIRSARARACVRLGRWAEAAADFAVISRQDPGNADAPLLHHAATLCLAGDDAGYRKVCAAARQRFEATNDPLTAFGVARICVLVPDGAPDPAVPLRLARKAVQANPHAWYLSTLGFAHLRAGQLDQALSRLEESQKVSPEWAPPVTWLGLALVHHHLGHTEEGRRWRDKAVAWADGALRDMPAGEASPPRLHLNEWLEYLVLRREVDALLK